MKYLQKCTSLLLTLSLVLALVLAGCSHPFNAKQGTQPPTALKKGKSTAEPDTFINNGEFYKAIEQLNSNFANDARVRKALLEINGDLSQFYINAQTPKIVVWRDFGFASVLVVFKKDGSKWIPYYFNSPGQIITGVRYSNKKIADKNLVEVTSYYATGSYSVQKVMILALGSDKLSEVWEYRVATTDSHVNVNNDTAENSYFYATYLISPDIQLPNMGRQDNPIIVVNETYEKIVTKPSQNDKVISRDKKSNQKLFTWNTEQMKFIESDNQAGVE